MNFSAANAQMADALKQLRRRWLQVQESWDDETRRRFEAEFIDPLEAKVRTAIKGVDYVSELAARARHDCMDDE